MLLETFEMPQFDFYTAFNQIFYGSFGFFALFLLLTLPGSLWGWIHILTSEKSLATGSFPSNFLTYVKQTVGRCLWVITNRNSGSNSAIPSYLVSFHTMFLARKIKVFFINRFAFLFVFHSYINFIKEFISFSNSVFGLFLHVSNSFQNFGRKASQIFHEIYFVNFYTRWLGNGNHVVKWENTMTEFDCALSRPIFFDIARGYEEQAAFYPFIDEPYIAIMDYYEEAWYRLKLHEYITEMKEENGDEVIFESYDKSEGFVYFDRPGRSVIENEDTNWEAEFEYEPDYDYSPLADEDYDEESDNSQHEYRSNYNYSSFDNQESDNQSSLELHEEEANTKTS